MEGTCIMMMMMMIDVLPSDFKSLIVILSLTRYIPFVSWAVVMLVSLDCWDHYRR